jgi:hypothetical protein
VKIHVVVLLALLIVPLFCGAVYVREFVAVDAALDSGASYDYVAGRADHAANHPFIPFSERHRTLLLTSGVLLVAAVLYGCWFAMSIGGRTRAI